MTVQDIINWFNGNPNLILGYFMILIIVSLIGLLVVKESNLKPPISYHYSTIIYGVSIPSLLAAILLLYNFFFLQVNLLEVDMTTYFVPIIAFIITLAIVNKTIPMKIIPGFKRISGLFILIITTFIITYALQRMFFGVFFIGRFHYLILFFLAILFTLKIAWNKIIK